MISKSPLRLGRWQTTSARVEIVERKGIGHPDTLCDALAEEFSRGLSQYYLRNFGAILHHNVDKALLRGGVSRAVFGGGEILQPIEIYLAGRATTDVGGHAVPVEEIAVEGSKRWLQVNFPELDLERDVRIHCLVRPGSADLTQLYARESSACVLANDTSFGVGYAPLSDFERLVLEVEQRLNSAEFIRTQPAGGRDVKVMGVRDGAAASLTVARAFISPKLASMDEYVGASAQLAQSVAGMCQEILGEELGAGVEIGVNVADDPAADSVYLTLTGTSAEAGDDGQVGRGNRVTGLITPSRPMSLEALAGKNPVSHVGKLYNVVATEIAERIIAELPLVEEAACYLVSAIGCPINEPQHVRIDLVTREAAPLEPFRKAIDEIVRERLSSFEELSLRLVAGQVRLF